MNDDDKARGIILLVVLAIFGGIMCLKYPDMTPEQRVMFWETLGEVVEELGDD